MPAHLKILAGGRFVLAGRRGTAAYYRVSDACVRCFPSAAGIVRGRPVPAAPAAVGACIGAAYWFTSSTSLANPAITAGRMFSDTLAVIAHEDSAPASRGKQRRYLLMRLLDPPGPRGVISRPPEPAPPTSAA